MVHVQEIIQPISPTVAAGDARSSLSWWFCIWMCLLLAVAQVLIGGYDFGVGNQSIQVPLLQRAIDSGAYQQDAMVTTTVQQYPTYFFRLLAGPAQQFGVEPVYRSLQLLIATALMLSLVALSAALFESRVAGLVAGAILVAGHLQALAGDGIYSAGFTHTFAVLPIAVFSMALAFRRQYALAFLLAGAIFNFHALTSAYLFVFLLAAMAAEFRNRKQFWRPLVALLLFIAAALPTVMLMLAHRQTFDLQWIGLTHIRSGDHSFPSTWWQVGSSDLPRFVLIAGLFALSLGVRAPTMPRRETLAMLIAAGGLFLVGYVFAERWSLPVVLRAQLFRCSRLVMVLFIAHIAYTAVRAVRMPWERDARLPRWSRWLEFATAALTLLTLLVPALLPCLPIVFAIGVITAVISGRLSMPQSIAVGVCVIVAVAAHHDIHFPLLAGPVAWFAGGVRTVFGLIVLGLAGCVIVHQQMESRRWMKLAVPASLAIVSAIFLLLADYQTTTDPWVQTQTWAAEHTPADSLFLTPIQPGGFRLHSQRAVVGEWRDGTQLYFSSQFAPIWWDRMRDLQPGILTDFSGKTLLSRGRSLASLSDEALVALATKYGATHIVLPKKPERQLPVLYANLNYAVYLPKLKQTEIPADVSNKDRWAADEKFMRETVYPNIEKNRKGDARVQVLDSAGRPLAGATMEIHQTRQAFDFSASLPFFQEPAGGTDHGDYRPPPVDPRELERFPEIFNYSMIPFSGKWMYIEPKEGETHYEELDRYIDWCTTHGVKIEYHFLSGYSAAWLRKKSPEEQGAAFLRHSKALAERYGGKIDSWQVVNETNLIQQSPAVFAELRKLVPNAKLGISDCAKFGPENSRGALSPLLKNQDMFRGLAEIRWLKQQGVKLDYFGIHGHRPFGLWPEASVMYQVFDTYEKEGVKIHVTEFSVPEGTRVLGNLRSGNFTPELQAEYYARFFTICFSHPDVDMVNLWGIGPNTWQPGAGLLDANYQPKPAFYSLKKLITETWRTNLALTLGADGAGNFRGFHGDYEAIVKLPSGGTVTAKFSISSGDANATHRFQLNDKNELADIRQ